jgi:hypothetical protein
MLNVINLAARHEDIWGAEAGSTTLVLGAGRKWEGSVTLPLSVGVFLFRKQLQEQFS